ncbi:hypothetical protein BU23DRAFT_147992 [Bimuria novae-zelandiae CBS 107.79]|uniref:DUF7053 domain-containing protein n=1 Tax=Bimuria novae-zelandiae CBS 107.79 TaxID=1447943 RepID=A0A6A5VTS2_9PLEO|nr:hypothetical protein BU23DRAFT_147992 [Bimuria novae-zelandiae CBS 107.79]
MSKTSVFTTVTPLPAGITRQSVIDMYHAHTEMIELNPLVIDRFKCKAPSYAPAEEYYSTWYTIKDKVNYLPGGIASSSVSYHACFHDLPDGLQTHVYAPLGLDIRAKWTVGGSLPGEPKAPVELGLGAPREGLYIREDVRMKCNIMMMSFVKKTFKESHAKMVDRLVEKAHVLESRQANERLNQLKNVAPGERMGHGSIFIAPPPGYESQSDYQNKPLPLLRESVHSDGSQEPSPGLSQASTLTSQSEFPQMAPQQYEYHRERSQSQVVPFPNPLASPPRQWQPGHTHSHSQDCNHTANFRFGLDQQKSPGQPQQQAETLSSLSYLPSTVYDPRANTARHSQYQAFQPPQPQPQPQPQPSKNSQPSPAELPAHMQDSPTLPRHRRNDRDDQIAELPA